MPNQLLLVANPVQKNLTLHNPHLSLIKTIEKIDYRAIQPRYLSTDNKNKIFISQSDHHKVTVTNLDMKMIKEIGSKGDSNYQFNYPLGVFYSDGSIYVCDGENKRIQKFNDNLTFQASFKVDFKPLSLRIINNYACIRSNSEDFVFFYSLQPLRLINKISIYGHSAIYSTQFWFYVFDSETKELNCYDVMGTLVDSVCFEFQNDINCKEKVSFEFLNNCLVFSCRLAKKLILFS